MLPAFANRAPPKVPDYTEGTWTPIFFGSGTAGTFTYTIQVGRYTRIGNLCFIRGHIAISAIAVAPTGDVYIRGLPLKSINLTNAHSAIEFGLISNFNYTNTAFQLTGRIDPNNIQIVMSESFDNVVKVDVPAANFTNAACELIFAGHYQISGA